MSRSAVTFVLGLFLMIPGARAQEEAATPRALFEAGRFQEAVDVVRSRVDTAPPEELYLAGSSLTRLDRNDEAREMYRRLDTGNEDDAWTFIGRSAIAVLDADTQGGLQQAQHAVELAPESFYAHYELGLVQTLRGEFSAAAASLERASQIDPGHAYAHYYAGLAYSKIRRADRMARHFESFVKLAPDAPERPQVETILRTLRF